MEMVPPGPSYSPPGGRAPRARCPGGRLRFPEKESFRPSGYLGWVPGRHLGRECPGLGPGRRVSGLEPEGFAWSSRSGTVVSTTRRFLAAGVRVSAGVGDAPPSRRHRSFRGDGPGLEWSALPAPLQLSLQFPDPGFDGIGAGLEVLVSDDVLPGLWVVPAQLSVVPPDGESVFLFPGYVMSSSVCSRGFFPLSSWSVLSLGSGSPASTMVVPSSSGTIIWANPIRRPAHLGEPP